MPRTMMPTVYSLKPRLQAALDPLVAKLHQAGMSADRLTGLGLLASGLAGLAVLGVNARPWLAAAVPACLLLRMALNAADGMLARRAGPTPRGMVFNEVADVAGDAVAYVPFAVVAPHLAWPITVILAGAFAGEMVAVAAVAAGGDRRNEGPLGKSDRAVAFSALALLLPFEGAALPFSLVMAALSVLTVFHRLSRIN